MSSVAAKRKEKGRTKAIFGQTCFYCRQKFPHKKLTFDHLIPKARGGGLKDNLVMSCQPCNVEKADRMPTDEELARAAALRVAGQKAWDERKRARLTGSSASASEQCTAGRTAGP